MNFLTIKLSSGRVIMFNVAQIPIIEVSEKNKEIAITLQDKSFITIYSNDVVGIPEDSLLAGAENNYAVTPEEFEGWFDSN